MAAPRLNPWIRSARVRERLGACALLALLLQAPIPAGFMPDGAGPSFLKLCARLITAAAAERHGSPAHPTITVCAFAAGAPSGTAPCLPTGNAAAPNPTLLVFATPARRAPPTGLSGPARAHAPRAPPALHG